ncbi:hypothetical protein I6G82_11060 [Lysinibacillus macroides]|uniref:Uncharacterized protein n=1 Tax=Lysinibacillus macroides TaxID=33935 RepID=A0A0M9DK60_9BACI|nr:hypothetical protein [Lysinibacillus macroides]KOY83078.1 hypothetical protein ADM90_07205 [Lysinibacillus macroides]QPR70065.1 hypothetical protein I6G82_11060 [Lysinibacillus macroides]
MEILNNFNVCLVFYYKGSDNLNTFLYEEHFKKNFKNLKNTELIFHPKIFKNDKEDKYKALKINHFSIYYNEEIQLVVGKNIFCVFLLNFEQIKSFSFWGNSGSEFIDKINLTRKHVINDIINVITDNILEITLSKENYFDYFDNYFFYGSSLQITREFEIIMENADLFINQFKFQFFGNSTVDIRDENLVEFGKEVTVHEKMHFIWYLSKLLQEIDI